MSLLISFLFTGTALAAVHHQVEIALTPALHSLTVTDKVSFSSPLPRRFLLHKNLQVLSQTPALQIQEISTPTSELYKQYELVSTLPLQEAVLQYSGIINDPVVNNESSGLISTEGAVLFGSSYWLPDFSEKATFEIVSSRLPEGWILASPSAQKNLPQQDVYLIAGPFTESSQPTPGGVDLKIYLRQPEPALAQTFLQLLPGYLDHYQKTLGDYPYRSFALIENFWETGFGMPGFTLLGSGVIRLPYILNSSLPHELLHNWWGNSVYVDYNRGNWCEGLTTYLADHWQQKVAGTDRAYRLQSLMNFQDYTKAAKDFPLRDFKQRFNFSSQAVGYGKGMMLFHMLSKELGESLFEQGLKDLYRDYLGKSISYEEIQSSFEKTSSQDLKQFFKQWLDRTGAPKLKIVKALRGPPLATKYPVTLELQQISPQVYDLLIPVRVNFKDGSQESHPLRLKTAQQIFNLEFRQEPQSLEVDPEVDVFRDLDPQERPVGLTSLFGASKIWIAGTDETLKNTYQQTWQKSLEVPLQVSDDKILLDLPPAGALVLLGDSPVYEKLMIQELAGQDFKIEKDEVRVLGQTFSRANHKTVFVTRSSRQPDLTLIWIRGSQIESLAPRLLHYGKFGVLVFSETAVPLRTTWPLLNSPLRIEFK